MGLRDDFVEALRSVKRDFFRDDVYSEQEKQAMHGEAPPPPLEDELSSPTPVAPMDIEAQEPPVVPYHEPPAVPYHEPPVLPYHEPPPEYDASYEAYLQASQLDESAEDVEGDDLEDFSVPYRNRQNHTDEQNYNSEMIPSEMEPYPYDDHHAFIDYGDSGIYDDDKTVISKNTIIRGALQTEDSVRLLGQILGDIDCKANVVLAGKVRGNTNAANAYIFDAQIDGDVRCDDIITISSDAWVLGNIRAQQAEIDGKIKGNMEIRHMVSIGASSSILGDISTDELEVKRGAFVNGQIMMYSPARDVLDRFDRFED